MIPSAMSKNKTRNKYVKKDLARKIEAAAERGRFIPYRELADFAAEKYPKEFPKNDRRRLVDYLDAINRDSCRDGYLLSIIVVNDDGMPDSGFFRKLKEGAWPMKRLSPPSVEHERDEKIFRHEAARVFRAFRAPVGIHVFMDLENIPAQGERDNRESALDWLKDRGNVKLCGHAFSLKGQHKRKVVFLTKHKIQKHEVVNTGKDASDAALLVEFGRHAFRVPDRDYVCIMGTDAIYNQAVELALKAGVKILHFRKGKELPCEHWRKGFYRVFDITDPEQWDAQWPVED